MKTILAPIDFSSVTDRIAHEAIELAKLLHGHVVLLHVVQLPAIVRDVLPVIDDTAAIIQNADKSADGKLAQLKKGLRQKFAAIDVVRLNGSPTACILEQAAKYGVPYIVIGSHGHNPVYDMLVGSTTSGVLKKAPCPVLIIPSAREEAPAAERREAALATP